MPVARAIDHWSVLEEANIPLVSPSPIHDHSNWMRTFMTRAKEAGKRQDYVGVHWYGGPFPDAFKKNMLATYERNGRMPLLITEFAPGACGIERLCERLILTTIY